MPTIYFIAMVLSLLLASLYIALTAAFIILLIGKLGIRDYVVARAPKLLSQLFDCDFCLSFWVSAALTIILAVFFKDMSILLVPVISTPITRILI